MPRANIDLSWLAGLLTKNPTKDASNPAYQATQADDNTWQDAKGNDVTAAYNLHGNQSPYKTGYNPSLFQKQFYPEESDQVMKALFAPKMAQITHDVGQNLSIGDWKKVKPFAGDTYGNIPDDAAALMTGKDLSATNIGTQARAVLGNLKNIAMPLASGDLSKAKVYEGEMAGDVNRLAGSEQLKATALANQNEYQSENVPAQHLVDQFNQRNALRVAQDLDPLKVDSDIATASLNKQVESEKLANAPALLKTLKNTITSNLGESWRTPTPNVPAFDVINPDGTFTRGDKNLDYRSPQDLEMESVQKMMAGLTGSKTNGVVGKGQFVTADGSPLVMPEKSNRFDPMTGKLTPSPVKPFVPRIKTTPTGSPPQIDPTADRIKQIDAQLNDSEFSDRADMYPQFAKQRQELLNEKELLKKQLIDESESRLDPALAAIWKQGMRLSSPSVRPSATTLNFSPR